MFFVLSSFVSQGQQNKTFVIEGSVKVEKGDATGASVRTIQNGQVRSQTKLLKKGTFKLSLDLNQEYILEFDKTGYYGKKILVSTEVPSYTIEREQKIKSMLIEVYLYKEQATVSSFDLLDQAVGTIFFNQSTQQFDNKIYLTPNHIKSKLKTMVAEIQKEIQQKDDKEDNEDATKRKDYDRLIAEADKQFAKDELEDAKTTYTKALDLYPNEVYPGMQIDRINKKLQAKLDEEHRLKDIENRYKTQIEIADKLFKQEEYTDAKNSYNEALSIKPGDEYAVAQIKECTRLGELKSMEKRYEGVIAKADGYFDSEQYKDAKESYKDALSIKPGAQYPIDQISKVDEKLADLAKQNQIDKLYTKAMGEGNEQMAAENYIGAIASFRKALTFKEGDQTATTRLSEAQKLLQQKEIDDKYRKILNEADNYYKDQQLPQALAKYEEASALKTDEEYPKKRIAEIKKILDKQKEFDALLAQADKLFKEEDYLQAKDKYTSVLKLEPTHITSKNRIKEIDKILANQKEDEKYDKIIKLADQYFETAEFEDAISKYEEALAIKPFEDYPKRQINKAKAELAKIKKEYDDLERQYNTFIESGDKAFEDKSYKGALQNYEQAIGLKADEEYPKKRVAEIKKILESAAKLEELIEKADELFALKKYDDAKKAYQAVLSILPEHQHSKDRISLIDKLKNDKDMESQYADIVKKADKLFEDKKYKNSIELYQSALAIKPEILYPQQQIELAKAQLAKMQSGEQRQEQFNQLVAKGDAALVKKDYDAALANYREAKILIDNDFINEKITDVLKIIEQNSRPTQNTNDILSVSSDDIAERILMQEKYNKFINMGNKYFKSKEYENALTNYNAALKLKPGEKYPVAKIDEINKALAFLEQQKALAEAAKNEKPITYDYSREITPEDDGYNKLMEYGNNLYDSDMYRSALKYYLQASKIRPDREDCYSQIAHVKELLAELESKLAELVEEGKQYANDKDWDRAIATFNTAKDVDTDAENDSKYDEYIADTERGRLKEESEGRAEVKETFSEILNKSREETSKGNFTMAEFYLRKASSIEPNNQQLTTVAEEIERERANKNSDNIDAEYKKNITLADEAFVNNQLGTAKYHYNKALEVRKDDKYARSRLREVELQIEQNAASY